GDEADTHRMPQQYGEANSCCLRVDEPPRCGIEARPPVRRDADPDIPERHDATGCELCDGFFFSSRRRHTRCLSDWSSDVCSSDLDCDGEANETDSSLDFARDCSYISDETHRALVAKCTEVRMLGGMMKKPGSFIITQEIGRASCRERV